MEYIELKATAPNGDTYEWRVPAIEYQLIVDAIGEPDLVNGSEYDPVG